MGLGVVRKNAVSVGVWVCGAALALIALSSIRSVDVGPLSSVESDVFRRSGPCPDYCTTATPGVDYCFGNCTAVCCGGYSGAACNVTTPVCGSSPCLNGGTCVPSPQQCSPGYNCTCTGGFTGANCQTPCSANCSQCQAISPGSSTTTCSVCTNNTYLYGTTCVVSCPAGYTNTGTGLTGRTCVDINECQVYAPCQHSGVCSNTGGSYNCDCTGTGYSGPNCTVDTFCGNNPCQHNANCTNLRTTYNCTCPVAYTGTNCETAVNFCQPNPCQNFGNCTSGIGFYSCSCPSSFSGTNCQNNVACQAQPSPCLYGSTCIPTATQTGYTCNCTTNSTGPNCATMVDLCAANTPCQNGGTCNMINVGVYQCSCPLGYTGRNCESLVDNCASGPCLNGSTCVNSLNNYTCNCAPGLTGRQCNINASLCATNPCQNGGTCNGYPNNTRSCSCAFGYNGTFCQSAINYCSNTSWCQHSGTCNYLGPGLFNCTCNDFRYSGSNCQYRSACLVNSSQCEHQSTCVNWLDTFNCSCIGGYSGRYCELLPGASTAATSDNSLGISPFILWIIIGLAAATILLIGFVGWRYYSLKRRRQVTKGRVGDLHAYVNPAFVGFGGDGSRGVVNTNYQQAKGARGDGLQNSQYVGAGDQGGARGVGKQNPLYDNGGKAGDYDEITGVPQGDGYLVITNAAGQNNNNSSSNNPYDVAKRPSVSAAGNPSSGPRAQGAPSDGAYFDPSAAGPGDVGYLDIGSPKKAAASADGNYFDPAGAPADGAYLDIAGKKKPDEGAYFDPSAGAPSDGAYLDVNSQGGKKKADEGAYFDPSAGGSASGADAGAYLDIGGQQNQQQQQQQQQQQKKAVAPESAYFDPEDQSARPGGPSGAAYLSVDGKKNQGQYLDPAARPAAQYAAPGKRPEESAYFDPAAHSDGAYLDVKNNQPQEGAYFDVGQNQPRAAGASAASEGAYFDLGQNKDEGAYLETTNLPKK